MKEAFIGSHIDDHRKKLKKNLSQISSYNGDFVIMAAAPEKLEWREKYLIEFLPLASQDWVVEFMENNLKNTKKKIEAINNELNSAKDLAESAEFGEAHKELEFGAKLYLSEEDDPISFLTSIQNEFEGKAIIVDLWATWCSPCIQDMKESKDIKEEMKDLPVEIIYVCTSQGGDIRTWEKRIAEIKSKGNHIFINKKLTASLFEQFELSGYPSYLFFTKNRTYKKDVIERISSIDIDKLDRLVNK